MSAFNRYCGVDVEELSADEVAEMFPLARTDDILAGFYVAGDGRVNPVDVTMSMAKGARQTGRHDRPGRHASTTSLDPQTARCAASSPTTARSSASTSSTPPGCGPASSAARSGVTIPLQAAEHYYLITDEMEGLDPAWPVIEDPGNYGYYREEVGGLMIGLFETGVCAVEGARASPTTRRSPRCHPTGTGWARTSRRR